MTDNNNPSMIRILYTDEHADLIATIKRLSQKGKKSTAIMRELAAQGVDVCWDAVHMASREKPILCKTCRRQAYKMDRHQTAPLYCCRACYDARATGGDADLPEPVDPAIADRFLGVRRPDVEYKGLQYRG